MAEDKKKEEIAVIDNAITFWRACISAERPIHIR